MSEENNVQQEIKSPVEKPKKEITEKQKQALAKARLQRQINAEKKNQTEIFSFSPSYLVATGVLGFGGLVAYYYLRQQQNSQEWQKNLEDKLLDLKKNMPKLPETIEKIVYTPTEPKIIEKEVIREVMVPQVVEKKEEISSTELRKQQLFSGATKI